MIKHCVLSAGTTRRAAVLDDPDEAITGNHVTLLGEDATVWRVGLVWEEREAAAPLARVGLVQGTLGL